MRKLRIIAMAAALAASVVAPAIAAEFSPEMQAVIAAANKEGVLKKLSWSGTTLGGASGAKRLEQGMNAAFGTKVAIEFAPGPNMGRVGQRLMTELKAGHAASADAYLGSDRDAAGFVAAGLYLSVPWTALLPDRITPQMVGGDGAAVSFVSYVQGFAYNTKLMPVPPRSLVDFLKPELKGKFAVNENAIGFELLGSDEFWGRDRMLDYVRKLSAQAEGLMRCGDTNRIASGEYAAFVLDCGAGDTITVKDQGAPVDHANARDFAPLDFFYLGVPKHAEHPAAGKLFVAFMLTPPGEALAWELWRNDSHWFPESHAAAMLADLAKEGVKPTELPFTWSLNHPDADKLREEVVRIFAGGH